ncbi:hypothetical protein [Spirosoma validum]|uniref:Uncharacterized protein n=1 Tax=Spirosoma validum TaxID=2771355 RepID=A0A927AZ40_9BACT|nr:hypothetical protein [Spirosoma validum]MBD2752312.1 hypothetical protein [Spirosoma validum]
MDTPRRRINIELLLGISATFLSLAALVVSIFQTKIAREQQEASVWPRIATSSGVLELNFTYSVANQGVGPAIIKSVETIYKGHKYPTLSVLLFQHTGHLNGGFMHGTLEPEMVLKAGDEYELFKLMRNDEPLSSKLEKIVTDSSFHFRIRYADIYGNCWQLDQNKVTELGKCPQH